ncbi:arylsulfatase [candidate division KSB1 bacterium]|nr:sulfatase [candidate division KSB1 bacterium]RQW01255.1 MAG: arylsulfatase [candidate division KSB1 bacterium]
MKAKRILLIVYAVIIASFFCSCSFRAEKPNIVIIFLDDSGWADFPPFAEPAYSTPHVQHLAAEGCCYTNFYVPQAVCSASRSALMTGCYPGRTKVFGAHPPKARGLDTQFATLGEVLQKAGYKTAVYGKWHLGDQPETRPPARGFDESCGLMYSNDMWEFHPENPDYWGQWPLWFWENDSVTIDRITEKEQAQLTTWYTEHAVDFIKRHKEHPFFLYVPHSMPHVPLFVSDKFAGKSGVGLYGDVMMEIDWSVGEIMHALKENGLEDNTLVFFSSDNGPWISYGNHAGVTPFREAKGTSFDGGTRSACFIKYPKKIKGNTTSEAAFCTIDILPTLCSLASAELPDNEIDGFNVWDLIVGSPDAVNPHDYYAFSTGSSFEAVMSGDGHWKLHLPHHYRTLLWPGHDGQAGKYEQKDIEAALFDMRHDPYEQNNVIDQFPEIAAELQEFAAAHQAKFYRE